MSRRIVKIDGVVNWIAYQDPVSGYWIGQAPAIGLAAEAETWSELCSVTAEIVDDWLRSRLRDGTFLATLRRMGWRVVAGAAPARKESVRFDVPVVVQPSARPLVPA